VWVQITNLSGTHLITWTCWALNIFLWVLETIIVIVILITHSYADAWEDAYSYTYLIFCIFLALAFLYSGEFIFWMFCLHS
jgi:hypothetical protein